MTAFDRAWDLLKSDDVKSLIGTCKELIPLVNERESEALGAWLRFLEYYDFDPSQYEEKVSQRQIPSINAVKSELNLLLRSISEKPNSPLAMPLMDDSGWMPFGEDLT
jgi:hypothetical protein